MPPASTSSAAPREPVCLSSYDELHLPEDTSLWEPHDFVRYGVFLSAKQHEQKSTPPAPPQPQEKQLQLRPQSMLSSTPVSRPTEDFGVDAAKKLEEANRHEATAKAVREALQQKRDTAQAKRVEGGASKPSASASASGVNKKGAAAGKSKQAPAAKLAKASAAPAIRKPQTSKVRAKTTSTWKSSDEESDADESPSPFDSLFSSPTASPAAPTKKTKAAQATSAEASDHNRRSPRAKQPDAPAAGAKQGATKAGAPNLIWRTFHHLSCTAITLVLSQQVRSRHNMPRARSRLRPTRKTKKR